MESKRMRDFIFGLTFGLLATHELDAMRWHEWRVLPMTRFFPDEIGMMVFILAHVPLFAWASHMCWSGEGTKRLVARRVFAGFCIVHVGLHWLFRNDPAYEFTGWLSNGLILGAGLFGALFLALTMQGKSRV
jgi:hypothetical protein